MIKSPFLNDQLRELRELYPSNLEDRHFVLALELYAGTRIIREKLATSYKRTRAFLEDLCQLATSAETVDSSWALQFVFRADDQVRGALATLDEILDTLKGRLDSWEDGDLEEAIGAAQKIGDDYLQKRARGQVMPESFTHGTSAQRGKWLRNGLTTGDLRGGDTFSQNYNQL